MTEAESRGPGVNLRVLRNESTLVLAFATGHSGDLSKSPIDAIERIELLPDDASVGNCFGEVVNIIPRGGPESAERRISAAR